MGLRDSEKILKLKGGARFNSSILLAQRTLLLKGVTLENEITGRPEVLGVLGEVMIEDSSLNFNMPFEGRISSTSNMRFIKDSEAAATHIDPKNQKGDDLFLNKLQVPNASNSRVTVSIDGRPSVNLYTDNKGYLHLYLPVGEREVIVTDIDGNTYEKVFDASTERETVDNQEMIDKGEMGSKKDPTTITFPPHVDTDIEYSFDNKNWRDKVTDSNCQFEVVVPDGVERIYLKVNDKFYYTEIDGETNGEVREAEPIITAQSSDIAIFKGSKGSLVVAAQPFIEGNTLTYQWYKSNTPIAGATKPMLTIDNAQDADVGVYYAVITESDGKCVQSKDINISIISDSSGLEQELEVLNVTLFDGHIFKLF